MISHDISWWDISVVQVSLLCQRYPTKSVGEIFLWYKFPCYVNDISRQSSKTSASLSRLSSYFFFSSNCNNNPVSVAWPHSSGCLNPQLWKGHLLSKSIHGHHKYQKNKNSITSSTGSSNISQNLILIALIELGNSFFAIDEYHCHICFLDIPILSLITIGIGI